MNETKHIFTKSQYLDLGMHERHALLLLAKQIEPTTISFDKYGDDDFNDLFELYEDCNGCVPEAYINDGDVLEAVIRKFRCIHNAAIELSKEKLNYSEFAKMICCNVHPSYEDDSTIIIHNDFIIYYIADMKAWLLHFNNLACIAQWIIDLSDQLVAKHRAVSMVFGD